MQKSTFADQFVEKGVIFLLIFTPLAFGTVQIWSIAVMEIVSFAIFSIYVIKKIYTGEPLFPDDPPRFLGGFFILFAAMTALVIFQMLPLPQGILKLLSPASFETYRAFGLGTADAFYPISLNPLATRQELVRVLACAAVFFVVISHYRTKEQIETVVKTILWMAGFLVIFAIVQKMTWNGRIFWFYPVEEALKSGAGIWGPYINRNHFAGYLEMAIPLGLGMLLYTAPRLKALPDAPFSLKFARFLANDKMVPCAVLFALLLIMAAALLMTLSRGGIIAFIVSCIFFARITSRRRSLRNKTMMLGILAAVLVASVVFAAWAQLADRFADLKDDHISRLTVFYDSIGIVRDYPLLGTGLGTFENAYLRYQTTMPRHVFEHAHNDYIELITTAGIIGFLIAVGMALIFVRGVWQGWRRKRGMYGKCIGAGGLASLLAIAVHSFTDFNLHVSANSLLFAVVAAITYASVFNVGSNKTLDQ